MTAEVGEGGIFEAGDFLNPMLGFGPDWAGESGEFLGVEREGTNQGEAGG